MAFTAVAPSLSEMTAAAREATITSQIRGLLTWLGDGRKLTRTGHIKLSDARGLIALLDTGDAPGTAVRGVRSSAELPCLARTVGWAKAAGLVRVAGGRLVPQDPGLAGDPLDLVLALLTAYPGLGDALFIPNGRQLSPVAEHFSDFGPAFLLALLGSPGPCPVAALSDVAYRIASERYVAATLTDAKHENLMRTIGADVVVALSALQGLGVAVLQLDRDGDPGSSGATAELTDLGRYAICRVRGLAPA